MEKTENKGIFARIWNWFRNLTISGLLSGIFILLVILILISSLRSLPTAINSASNSLTGALYSVFVPAQNATMSADKTVVDAGEAFKISFKAGDNTNGLYKISYPCNSGTELKVAASAKSIPCDTEYYVTEKDNSITLIATPADPTTVTRVTLTGYFEDNNTLKSVKTGVVRITVRSSAVDATPTKNQTQTTTGTKATQTINVGGSYIGKPDLAVTILQTGVLNRTTGYLTSQSTFSSTDRVGVKFEVRNDGDVATGAWSFTATLPSQSTPTYRSDTQVSLNPGDKIIFTLGFDNLVNQYSNVITVNVDPAYAVSDSDRANNTDSVTISNTNFNNYYNYNGYNNNYYGQQQYYGVIDGTCYASPSNPQAGQTTTWYVTPTGGSNGAYTYYWSGTDGLSSYSQNPTMTYYSSGYKTASVVITSNGQSVTKTCSTNVGSNYNNNNYNNGNLTVSCYAGSQTPSVGNAVYWYATAAGGNGNYSFYWNGTDNFFSYSQNPSMIYYTNGTKNAMVTVTSGGYTATANCNINVGGGNNWNNYGQSDLNATITNVGTVNAYGQFTAASTISRGQTAAVQVTVTNNGAYASGPWIYTSTLTPSFPYYTYTSGTQNSLSPGQSVTLTISFVNAQTSGSNQFSVTIDPNNQTNDAYRSNNTTSSNIYIY